MEDTFKLVISAVLIGVCWLIFGWARNRMRLISMMNKLPHQKSHFLFGNMKDVLDAKREDRFEKALEMINYFKDEDLFGMWLGPNDPCVMLLKAEAVEVLLSTNDHLEKSDFYQFLYSWIGRGLLTSDGAKWHSRRKMLTPSFHFKILDEFADVINKQASILASKIENKYAIVGKAFDLHPLVSLCTLDIICETAMQKSVNAQGDDSSEYVQAVLTASRILSERFVNPWLQVSWIFGLTSLGRQYRKALHIMHSFTDKVIAERRQECLNEQTNANVAKKNVDAVVFGQKRRRAFLDTLLDCHDSGQKLSDKSIREEVDTFMFEGHDTTSSGIVWTIYLLGLHPSIQDRVYQEIDAFFAGDSERALSSSDVKELKYLECVIKESLRLYPPVPQFSRKLHADTRIAGYDLLKGTTVQVNTYNLHRDPRHFPDPETFDPDRFLGANTSKTSAFTYVPFSAGPRNCIGQRFALMEEKIVLAHLLHRFKITSMEQRQDIKLILELILRPANGLWITVEKRV